MQIGKTYTTGDYSITRVFTCFGFDKEGWAVLATGDNPSGKFSILVPPQNFKNYVEYKEPRKGTVWVNIYDGMSGLHSTRDSADRCAAVATGRLACVEVPWVEGQGLERPCPNGMHESMCTCKGTR